MSEKLFNLRMVSDDFGKLVEADPDKDCCPSCIREQEDGVVSEYSDYCCHIHGEVYAHVYKGDVKWITDESQRLYEQNRGGG